MSNLPQAILARVVGYDRAAAILGDLTEMAATRGRIWFWVAYVRTLISLGWRTPTAFLCAYGFSTWVAVAGFPTIHSIFRSYFRGRHNADHQAIWHVFNRLDHAAYQTFWAIPLGDSLLALWFILPFVVVRFGLRDRLAQLASAIFLLTLPFFSLSPGGVIFAGFITAAMLLTALCLGAWRRPMFVLAASVAPIALAILFSSKVWYVFISRGYGFDSPQLQRFMAFYRLLELCLAAMVCSFLYRRLLQVKPADRGNIA